MISEEELEQEIAATKAFMKAVHKSDPGLDWPELQGYLDGLIFVRDGKLD